jgi:4-hydroxythreonine-4-phosphate dehydrogenase
MNYKPIVILNGEPNSVFLEIFFKALKKKYRSHIILISSINLLKHYMKKFNFKKNINIIDINNLKKKKLKKNSINLINIDINLNTYKKISTKSNDFIKKSFDTGLKLTQNGFTNKLINGPISKKSFLNKKFPGITEYISSKTKTKKFAMLIFNKKLSVCPITTHVPIKNVPRFINKKNITEKIYLINNFYKKTLGIKPRIGVLGLNPHCESTSKFNEDEKILVPLIKKLSQNGLKLSGPYAADTAFLKNNRSKLDVIVGMYHDQVLTPMKTLFEYDAINITLGLPFVRISPDHGPNEKMIGKNISDPLSLIRAIEFLDKKID